MTVLKLMKIYFPLDYTINNSCLGNQMKSTTLKNNFQFSITNFQIKTNN